MEIDWVDGSRSVGWRGRVDVRKTFRSPPLSVVATAEPPSVLVVEEIDPALPCNAVVFNEDGTERLRLEAPDLPEAAWRLGYYLAYVDDQGELTAVYSTSVGDLRVKPDLGTGEVLEIHEWR